MDDLQNLVSESDALDGMLSGWVRLPFLPLASESISISDGGEPGCNGYERVGGGVEDYQASVANRTCSPLLGSV